MSMFLSRLGLALVLAALCLGGRTAHAQADPVRYWIPGWPFGFAGNSTDGQGASTYGDFPSFDGRAGAFSSTRYNFSNGMFVGSEAGGMGLSANGFNRNTAFGGSLDYQGVQFGYNFKGAGGLPVTLFGGFDTVKYNPGLGGPMAFDSTSSTLPGYSVHGGVEFRPTSNLSLSLGFGYAQQQSGRIDSDINSSVLPGASPSVVGGFR
jgi:opacity protein-like surface antigen